MITINSPITIKTALGTVLITVQHEDGQIIIETYQARGSARYRLPKYGECDDGELIKERTH